MSVRDVRMQSDKMTKMDDQATTVALGERVIDTSPGEAVVRLNGVGYRYGRRWVLEGVAAKATQGQVIGLFGPNGAGKSTLLQIMSGLLAPQRGSLAVCGVEWSASAVALAPFAIRGRLAGRVAYCPEEGGLFRSVSPLHNGMWMETVDPGFDLYGYRQLLERMEVDVSRHVSSLSKGQRARVRLALALSRQASLLLLDEPLSGLDPVSRGMVHDLLRDVVHERGTAAIISTHEIGEIEALLERVWVLADGKLTIDADADDLRGQSGRSLETWAREGMKA